MTVTTILIIDDEPSIRKLLGMSLETAGYKVIEAGSGLEGARMAASMKPALVLLDLGLPDINGKEVIAQIRDWSQMPIIVCSAQSGDEEMVRALQAGADDYVVKPFNPNVLLARIQANLRKTNATDAGEPELVNGGIRMDIMRHEVQLNGQKITLTPKEYELLRFFLTHRGKMLTHREILKSVWGESHVDDMQYLRVYVRQLREKLEGEQNAPRMIITEPGIGYRMETIG